MPRLLVGMLVALGVAWVYMVSDENRFEKLERAADAILDRLLSS
jgi:hypothetical protein